MTSFQLTFKGQSNLKVIAKIILDFQLEELYYLYAKFESIVVFKITFPTHLVLIYSQKSVLIMRK